MLQIDRTSVDTVRDASSGEELVALVQEAIRLEFSTIPPYLTAMLSLKPGQNRKIWWTIHDVVVDEMLHMTIAANLLNAPGGRPTIADPDFVPTYPSRLPLGIGTDLVVGLERYSRDLVKRLFMEIEEPEHRLSFPVAAAFEADLPTFATVGEFYRTLGAKLVEQGWRRAQQFRVTFTRLLMALQRVFDGEPEHLDAAMGVMFEVKLAGQVLASQPAKGLGIPNAKSRARSSTTPSSIVKRTGLGTQAQHAPETTPGACWVGHRGRSGPSSWWPDAGPSGHEGPP